MYKFISHSIVVIGLMLSHVALAAEAITNTEVNTQNSIAANANHSQYLLSQMTETAYEKLSVDQQKELAAVWNLSPTDYQHYLWLMEHTPNSVYYQDKPLDPSWILGINAVNDQERQKFATIALKNERERINRELAFQREFTQLAKSLFPNERPIIWNPILSK